MNYKSYFREGLRKNVMGNTDEIIRLMQYLQNNGVRATPEFVNDLKKLIKTNIPKFAKHFFRDFTRCEYGKYNKFEKLKLSEAQKKRINGRILWRYEYRDFSNLRCIFIFGNVNNTNMPVLLCAFNEDGDKKHGANSYNSNIEKAIKLVEKGI